MCRPECKIYRSINTKDTNVTFIELKVLQEKQHQTIIPKMNDNYNECHPELEGNMKTLGRSVIYQRLKFYCPGIIPLTKII
jgi:hypothetical protein